MAQELEDWQVFAGDCRNRARAEAFDNLTRSIAALPVMSALSFAV